MAQSLGLAGYPVEIASKRCYTTYTGTKEALIAGGFAIESMFPEGRKRNKYHLGRDIPEEQQYTMEYRKGGVFVLQRWHEPEEPPKVPTPWNPEEFRTSLLAGAHAALNVFLIVVASGESERSTYGSPTHRLSQKDQDKLANLADQVLAVIANAEIERLSKPNIVQLSAVK